MYKDHMHVTWGRVHTPVTYAGIMEQSPAPGEPWTIDEDALTKAQPTVRGITVQRYEDLWRVTRSRIEEAEAGDRPLDPRLIELGIRILREEATLYRLSKPQTSEEEEDDPSGGVDRAKLVLEQLADLEARQKKPEQG